MELTPVSYAAKALVSRMQSPESTGLTLHLQNRTSLSANEVGLVSPEWSMLCCEASANPLLIIPKISWDLLRPSSGIPSAAIRVLPSAQARAA
jgi:hypothetical protein